MSNDVTMRNLIDGIETVRGTLRDEARGPAMARLTKRGTLSARTRLSRLLDAESFSEIGGLVAAEDGDSAAVPPARTLSPADGIVPHRSWIDGRPGGGHVAGLHRLWRQQQPSSAPSSWRAPSSLRSLPACRWCACSKAAAIASRTVSTRAISPSNGMFNAFTRASGWVPIVAAMLGAGFAGPTNYAGMADFVVMVRGIATMGHGGAGARQGGHRRGDRGRRRWAAPPCRSTDRRSATSPSTSRKNAFAAAIRRFLSYLPANAQERPPVARPSDDRTARRGVARSRAGSTRASPTTCARSSACWPIRAACFEFKPTLRRNIVTGVRPARTDSRSASSPTTRCLLAGMLDGNACDKAAHFIAVCDAFGLPLVYLIDVPGFAIGSAAERSRIPAGAAPS